MKAYKLTDQNSQTKNNTQWGRDVAHEVSGTGELCSSGWLHCYEDARIAVIMNPIHGNYDNPQLWEAEAEGEIKRDRQLKMGCTKLITLKQIPIPKINTEQKVEFAIRCALEVYHDTAFVKWAENWLNNTDRTAKAAWAAGAAAHGQQE